MPACISFRVPAHLTLSTVEGHADYNLLNSDKRLMVE